jgi:hypothetical protein
MKMENLIKFKEAVFQKKDYRNELENCYFDLLNEFNLTNATLFINLLEMSRKNEVNSGRIEEILKVLDFVRFPIKRSTI